MSFLVSAAAYDGFMGRYSSHLSAQMCDLADVRPGARALDVGCGPGVLTRELVSRLGPALVSAADPSEPFVAAVRERLPGVDVRHASAESLPFGEGVFDAVLAQLVVHFMDDPHAGVSEMRRVTRAGGAVVACVWDHGGGRGPLSPFWDAVQTIDPGCTGESHLIGSRGGDLGRLFARAGLDDVDEGEIRVAVEHPSFDEWWEPFTRGVGPAGTHVARLDDEPRARLRAVCAERLGQGPFTIEAWAWTARGTV